MIKHALVFALLLAGSPGLAYAAGPLPPCGAPPIPAWPAPGAAPTISLWNEKDIDQLKWQPAACTGWAAPSRSRLVVALAGSIRFDGNLDSLLGRIGAISAVRSMKYWSTSEDRWRPLANDASALSAPDAKARRADFEAADFKKGGVLHYWVDDTRMGPVTYRATVLESGADSAVISSENITPVRQVMMTIFPPGALQSVIVLQRTSPGIVGIYILTRAGDGASFLAGWREASYMNRSLALYRQLAGIRTDQEPPAVR